MLPTVIVFGVLAGRWWAIPVAIVAWPLMVLVASDTDLSLAGWVFVGLLGAGNAAAGVLLRSLIDVLFGRPRNRRRSVGHAARR